MTGSADWRKLRSGLEELGLPLQEDKIQKLIAYIELLIKWNKVYNLTAITKKEEIISKHILDSLAALPYLKKYCPPHGKVLDAGSGAGLPGIPLAIYCEDLEFTLIDAVQKKTAFQVQAAGSLHLSNVHPLHARLESKSLNQKFDVIISRALSSLKDFTEITKHLSENGTWLALKANLTQEEMEELSEEFVIKEHPELNVPFADAKRQLVVMQENHVKHFPKS